MEAEKERWRAKLSRDAWVMTSPQPFVESACLVAMNGFYFATSPHRWHKNGTTIRVIGVGGSRAYHLERSSSDWTVSG